jgi:hypothetical protein
MDSYTNTIKVEIATGTLTVLNNSTLAVIDDETGAWAGANGIFSVMYGDYGSYNTYRYNITDNNFYSAAYPPNIFRTGAMCSSQDGKYIYAYSHVTITEHNGLVRRCCLVKYKPT